MTDLVERAVKAAERGLKAYEYFLDDCVPNEQKIKYEPLYDEAWTPVAGFRAGMTLEEDDEFVRIISAKIDEINARVDRRRRELEDDGAAV